VPACLFACQIFSWQVKISFLSACWGRLSDRAPAAGTDIAAAPRTSSITAKTDFPDFDALTFLPPEALSVISIVYQIDTRSGPKEFCQKHPDNKTRLASIAEKSKNPRFSTNGHDAGGVCGHCEANGPGVGLEFSGSRAYAVGLLESVAGLQGIGGDELHPSLSDFEAGLDIQDDIDGLVRWVYGLVVECFSIFRFCRDAIEWAWVAGKFQTHGGVVLVPEFHDYIVGSGEPGAMVEVYEGVVP